MTILFLTRKFYPDVGGVEKHVLEIGKLLVKNKHKVIVATESQGKEKIVNGIEIFRIKSSNNWFKKFYIWKWLWENRTLISISEIVHAHDVYFWYFPFRFLYPRKKSFVTFHGYETYPIKKKAIWTRKLSEKLANGNIIVGDFIKKWYGTKPDYVTYGAVEMSNVKSQISNKPKRESAVFIGRLDKHTGILDYAKAVDLIRKEYPKFKFTILGDGEYKSKLNKYKPLGFKNNSLEYLKKNNFAFVSRYLAILEALANKRLVFALYDNPVKEDYLKMAPFAKFIIIEKTPEKIKEKVEYLLNNPEEENKFKNNGFNWVKKQTWENITDTYLKLWAGK